MISSRNNPTIRRLRRLERERAEVGLLEGLDEGQLSYAVPGTRRSGGMISSLSGGLESRRTAVTEATMHALSTLFYGKLESRSIRGGRASRGGA